MPIFTTFTKTLHDMKKLLLGALLAFLPLVMLADSVRRDRAQAVAGRFFGQGPQTKAASGIPQGTKYKVSDRFRLVIDGTLFLTYIHQKFLRKKNVYHCKMSLIVHFVLLFRNRHINA